MNKANIKITLDVDYDMDIYSLINELKELTDKHGCLRIYQPTELSFDNKKEIYENETTKTNT